MALDDFPDQPDTPVGTSGSKPDLSDFPDVSDFPDKPTVKPGGLISRTWHAISDPLTDAPSRFAKSVADYIDQPVNADDSYLSGLRARAKGFAAGATEGLGNIASSLTSPLSLATIGLGGAEYAAGKTGFSTLANAANFANKVVGAPLVAHGAINVLHPDSTLSERAQGLAEMAGGGLAMAHTPVGSVGKAATEAAEEAPKSTPNGPKVSTKNSAGVSVPELKDVTVKLPAEDPQLNLFGEKPKAAPKKGAPLPEGVVDPFAKYREMPVGTEVHMSPDQMNFGKLRNAIKLGFDVSLDDSGKIKWTKTKDSPMVDIPETPEETSNIAARIANVPRELMASMDMSAPFRQGLGLIHRKEFWQNLPEMVKAFGKEDFYNNAMKEITSDPMFQKKINAVGQVKPSFAEESGLKLTNMKGMTREETMGSGGLLDKIPGVRASERAYSLFLNKTRADVFKSMVNEYQAFSGMNMRNNLPLAKDLATVVNTATGRGSLGPLEGSAAKNLANVFFSPRLMASRIQMMNPMYYVGLNPIARKEALKSLFAVAGATGTFTTMMKMAGANVETDIASSDAGKVKFGDTRIDPYGGFQQYIVAAQRLMPNLEAIGLPGVGGRMKSTTTEQEYNLFDPKFGRSTRADVLSRFFRSKTNPIINFGWGLLAGQKELSGKPMNFTSVNPLGGKGENLFDNSIAQRFIPMLLQDVYDLYQDETTPPQEKALAAFLASVGMGSQTYGREQ